MRGQSFDKIIFGIPAPCVPFVCTDLTKEDRGLWNRQHEIDTTPTMALQIWSQQSLKKVGWTSPPPLLSLFWDPINTWCDMTHVLPYEAWPTSEQPQMIAYFCGHFVHGSKEKESRRFDPIFEKTWREERDTQAKHARALWMDRLHHIWPNVGDASSWIEYLRVNDDPQQRCTMALPGQAQYRIHAERTGYANLTVAGDWTANDILVACLEGSVQSGIRAARAVSEHPSLYRIKGESLLNPRAPSPMSRVVGSPIARREEDRMIHPALAFAFRT